MQGRKAALSLSALSFFAASLSLGSHRQKKEKKRRKKQKETERGIFDQTVGEKVYNRMGSLFFFVVTNFNYLRKKRRFGACFERHFST